MNCKIFGYVNEFINLFYDFVIAYSETYVHSSLDSADNAQM